MDLVGYIVLITIISICIYQFFILKKLKNKLSDCIKWVIGLLVTNFFGIIFFTFILEMIFESNKLSTSVFTFISSIVFVIVNYLGIRDHELQTKNTKDEDIDTPFTKLITYGLFLGGVLLFSWLGYYYLKFSYILWNSPLEFIEFIPGNPKNAIVILINNLLVNIFGNLANEIASICIFLMGGFVLVMALGFSYLGFATIFTKKKD